MPEPHGWVPEPYGWVPEPNGWVPKPHGWVPEPHGWVPEPVRLLAGATRLCAGAARLSARVTRLSAKAGAWCRIHYFHDSPSNLQKYFHSSISYLMKQKKSYVVSNAVDYLLTDKIKTFRLQHISFLMKKDKLSKRVQQLTQIKEQNEMFKEKSKRNEQKFRLKFGDNPVYSLVLTLDCNSETGAHVRRKIFFSVKTHIPSCVRNIF